jgi:hypothetical protein
VLKHVTVMKGRRRYGATHSYFVDVPYDWFIFREETPVDSGQKASLLSGTGLDAVGLLQLSP